MMNRARQRGQTIVLFALAVIALLAMVSLVIDGGNAFAQQRATQNASDAASEAGAVVLADSILSVSAGGLPRVDADVLTAVNASAAANAVRPFTPGTTGNSEAYYTDVLGNMLTPAGTTTTSTLAAARVGAGIIPTCVTNCTVGRASGVVAFGSRDFSTFLGGLIGLGQFRATAQATAVTGFMETPCEASQGCALLPVTFAINQTSCAGNGNAEFTTDPWRIIPATEPKTAANESILTLCKNGPGAVGWLDLGGGNLSSQISNPNHGPIPIPTWLQTQPGNPNNLDAELSAYWGDIVGQVDDGDKVVLIPFFDATCRTDRPDNDPPVFPGPNGPFPGVCSTGQAGSGNNTYYHIPFFIGFLLDRTYTQGNNNPECNQPPGDPPSMGNGGTGCFKGWFVQYVGPPGPVSATPPPGSQNNAPLSVQLIK